MSRSRPAAADSPPSEAMTPAYAAARAEEQGDVPPRRATPADAFRAARRRFMAGERIDMQALAAELDVARGTLYRWTGDRERLLADIMSSITRATIRQGDAQTDATGAERVLAVLDYYFQSATKADYFRRFLENESALALRLVTTREAGVQDSFVDAIAVIIREEEDKGTFSSPVDADTLAYAIARLFVAFLYNDTITGLEPHPEQARAVLELLLRP